MQFGNKHFVILVLVVLIILSVLAAYWFVRKRSTNQSETFSNSDQVLIADGHCAKQHKSISDYYMGGYPYYPKEGYFKPLPVDDEGTLSFENRNYTTLYTNKI